MQAESPIAQRWKLMQGRLDERQRRAFAAAEAKVLGRGGVAQVVAATGVARNTIMAGMVELEGTTNEFMSANPLAPAGATRRSGGGRKPAAQKDPPWSPTCSPWSIRVRAVTPSRRCAGPARACGYWRRNSRRSAMRSAMW